LFVWGFPVTTTEDELLEEFKQYGLVKNLSIIPGKGFGIVSFETPQQAEEAIISLRDKPFKNVFLTIEVYENKQSRSWIDSGIGAI